MVGLEGDTVWVETLRQSACSSCSARAGCGHGVLNAAVPGASRAVVKARLGGGDSLVLRLHDDVCIELPERGFLRGAFALYALPILSTIVLAMVANWPQQSNPRNPPRHATNRYRQGLTERCQSALRLLESPQHDAIFQPTTPWGRIGEEQVQ